MVKIKYLNKPYFIAVLICCFIFYCGKFSIPQRLPLKTLIKPFEINLIKGQIISSPVKCSNDKYYSCKFSLSETVSSKEILSSASGIINIYIPYQMVEALYPGKLYSDGKKSGSFLYEAGGYYKFWGKLKCSKNKNSYYKYDFYVEKAKTLGFNKNTITGKIDYFRALCRLNFKRMMFSWKEAGGFLLALLSGSKEYTEKETSENFRKSGLSHILALSGMHLSLFSGIAVFIGKKIKRKKITFILRIISLILFVWFAGFSPSLLRAFICAALIAVSSLSLNTPPDMFLILCFSFLLQCIISPSDITNSGFLLSYGALAGILIFNNKIKSIFDKICTKYISSSLSASLSAQIFTAPVSLKLFGSFSPIGIAATCIVSPLVTFFIYSGLLLIILCLIFPQLINYSGIFVNFEYTVIKKFVFLFSKAPVWSIK